jgi:hypothetical protein
MSTFTRSLMNGEIVITCLKAGTENGKEGTPAQLGSVLEVSMKAFFLGSSTGSPTPIPAAASSSGADSKSELGGAAADVSLVKPLKEADERDAVPFEELTKQVCTCVCETL